MAERLHEGRVTREAKQREHHALLAGVGYELDSAPLFYAEDRIKAALSAMTTVIAMGWNIFPSTPVSAKIGT